MVWFKTGIFGVQDGNTLVGMSLLGNLLFGHLAELLEGFLGDEAFFVFLEIAFGDDVAFDQAAELTGYDDVLCFAFSLRCVIEFQDQVIDAVLFIKPACAGAPGAEGAAELYGSVQIRKQEQILIEQSIGHRTIEIR